MAIVKFRKGQWTLLKSKRDVVLPGGGGGGGLSLSAATPSADGRTYSGSGVKPLSTITVYAGGSAAGTTTADGSGNWSFTFASQPAQGTVVGYDAVFAAPTLAVPFVAPELIKFDLNARFVAEGDSITAGSNGPTWIGPSSPARAVASSCLTTTTRERADKPPRRWQRRSRRSPRCLRSLCRSSPALTI